MPDAVYEVVAQAARYWFAFLMLVIVWRSYRWFRRDRRQRKKRLRLLPDAGFVGELVVLRGGEELHVGTALPLPREGMLGFLRTCDVCVPVEGVGKRHLWFRFDEDSGLLVEPLHGMKITADGETRTGRKDPLFLHHGSRLTVGEAVLRMRLFAGFEDAASLRAPVGAYVDGEPADARLPDEPPADSAALLLQQQAAFNQQQILLLQQQLLLRQLAAQGAQPAAPAAPDDPADPADADDADDPVAPDRFVAEDGSVYAPPPQTAGYRGVLVPVEPEADDPDGEAAPADYPAPADPPAGRRARSRDYRGVLPPLEADDDPSAGEYSADGYSPDTSYEPGASPFAAGGEWLAQGAIPPEGGEGGVGLVYPPPAGFAESAIPPADNEWFAASAIPPEGFAAGDEPPEGGEGGVGGVDPSLYVEPDDAAKAKLLLWDRYLGKGER